MNDPIAYRSTHPDVLAHWENTASAAAQQAWRDRVNAAIADLGFPDRKFATAGRFTVIGVEHPEDEPIPDGWRRDRDLPTAIVPARRTKTGKDIGRRLDALHRPSPRRDLPGGMPEVAFARHSFMRCGVELLGGAVYVTWSDELDEADARHIDPQVWERVRLSQYYAAREAEQDGDGNA
ncbi:hypothetical protein ACFVH6_22200 [Spirillospora sp. NPDC127200]